MEPGSALSRAGKMRRGALLSASLYSHLAAGAVFSGVGCATAAAAALADPARSYGLMAQMLLPRGVVGLVLGGSLRPQWR